MIDVILPCKDYVDLTFHLFYGCTLTTHTKRYSVFHTLQLGPKFNKAEK